MPVLSFKLFATLFQGVMYGNNGDLVVEEVPHRHRVLRVALQDKSVILIFSPLLPPSNLHITGRSPPLPLHPFSLCPPTFSLQFSPSNHLLPSQTFSLQPSPSISPNLHITGRTSSLPLRSLSLLQPLPLLLLSTGDHLVEAEIMEQDHRATAPPE